MNMSPAINKMEMSTGNGRVKGLQLVAVKVSMPEYHYDIYSQHSYGGGYNICHCVETI